MFNGLQRAFQILLLIVIGVFLVVLIAYIIIVKIITRKRKGRVADWVGWGIIIVPLATILILYSAFQIGSAVQLNSMRTAASDYLLLKYELDKDDYSITDLYTYHAACVKDGHEFRVETIGSKKPNGDNLQDNFQTLEIERALNDYFTGIFKYPSEIDSYHGDMYTFDQKFEDDIAEFLKTKFEHRLEIYIDDNGDDLELVRIKIDIALMDISEILPDYFYVYICSKTPTRRTESDERNNMSFTRYIAYEYDTVRGWNKIP